MSLDMNVDVTQFVSKYYEMDPEIEDLLSDGWKLQNGMEVLVGARNARSNIAPQMLVESVDSARENNRWCTVSDVENLGNRIGFIATYDDGTKRKRILPVEYAWIVKRDSVPKHPHYDSVAHQIRVSIELGAQRKINSEGLPYLEISEKVDEITNEILRLFS